MRVDACSFSKSTKAGNIASLPPSPPLIHPLFKVCVNKKQKPSHARKFT